MASWFVPVFRYVSVVRVVKCAKFHVFSILVPCRDVHLDFRITIMFGSFLPEFALQLVNVLICYLYSFMHTGVQHDFHSTYYSCRLTVTQRVLLME